MLNDTLQDSLDSQDKATACYLPNTVNYHFIKACQMACQHCFAVFGDCGSNRHQEYLSVIRAVAAAPRPEWMTRPRRINFVGGEPTLYTKFDELVQCALDEGLRVSIVTNGFDLVNKGLVGPLRQMELIGVSVDSLDHETNLKIGRQVKGRTIGAMEWEDLFSEMDRAKIPLKINTTITKHNLEENLSDFILRSCPVRWKVFQAMPVEGQNCSTRHLWQVGRPDYDRFVTRHEARGVRVAAEPEDLMRGTYAMISPDGRFYDSVSGAHRYSEPIHEVGVDAAWAQIRFDPELFGERTKSYIEPTPFGRI